MVFYCVNFAKLKLRFPDSFPPVVLGLCCPQEKSAGGVEGRSEAMGLTLWQGSPTGCPCWAGSPRRHGTATPSFLYFPLDSLITLSRALGQVHAALPGRPHFFRRSPMWLGLDAVRDRGPNYCLWAPDGPEDHGLHLQVSVCSWLPPVCCLEIACLNEFNSGLPISKSRDHSRSPATSVIPGWWMLSDPPATPFRAWFPLLPPWLCKVSRLCKLFIPCHLPDTNRYRQEMKRAHFSNLTKSLIPTFLLVKHTAKMNLDFI